LPPASGDYIGLGPQPRCAPDEGTAFYTWAREIPGLREALAAFHQSTVGVAADPERVAMSGAAMLCIAIALSCPAEKGTMW
jgi:aspartate/methionine/tyrosine aminotransferase